MGTNVSLTPELERFAQNCVESGRYNNVSEVVRSALRMLSDTERKREAFVASLDAAIEEGKRDGFISLAAVKADVRATIDSVRAGKA